VNISSQLPMEGFVVNKLLRPKAGEIVLTHDIGVADFRQLAEEGIRYSHDGDLSDAIAVYEAIGRSEPHDDGFACCTAHISTTFQARSITAAYGRGSGITLIIDFASVWDRLLIFNGDVGRLGKALKSSDIDQTFIRALIPSQRVGEVAAQLASLVENNRRGCQIVPRLHGNSFEARIFGGILPRDISQVCLAMDSTSKDIQQTCERIWKLKQVPSGGAGPEQ